MVINNTGGNKTKKKSRSGSSKFIPTDKVDQGQMFAQITGFQGECRFKVICSDGVVRLGRLSGYMKKGPRITVGSYVVISLREFEQEQKKCDIISYGNPPYSIISIFKKNDVKIANDDIEFEESDDEYKDLDQSLNRRFDIPPSDSDEDEKDEQNETNKIDDKNNKDNKDDKDILVIKRKDKDNIPTKTIEEDEEIDWNDL